MKTWRLLLAVAVAAVAVLMMTTIVVAAPAATESAPINRVYDDPDPILTDTLPMTHPVGIAIATYFNIPYTQVMTLHAEGFGFGTIARAYLTALASNGALTPEYVLDMRQAGVGWGQFKQDYGVHPGGNGLGAIMGKKHTTPPGVEPSNGGSSCPGNSCNAPGQQMQPKVKPTKTPK